MDKIGKKRAKIIYLKKLGLTQAQIKKQTNYDRSYIFQSFKWFDALSTDEQKKAFILAIVRVMEEQKKLEFAEIIKPEPEPEPDRSLDGFRTPYTVQKNSKRFFYH